MSVMKDKLEIGLKPDAPYRHENLPDFQQDEAVDGESPEAADTDKDSDRKSEPPREPPVERKHRS